MTKSSEFINWLKTQEEEGRVESEGHFTIAQDKAWEKLAAYQLPFPEAWVLKFVQAAVAHPEAHLTMTQKPAESTFSFSGVADWERQALEQAVFSPDLEAPRDLKHLAVGLRALFQQKKIPFSVRYPDNQLVAWTGDRVSDIEVEDAEPNDKLTIQVAHFPFGESSSIFSLTETKSPSIIAGISRALTEHCHFTPQDLPLDGRSIGGHEFDPQFGVTNHSAPMGLLQLPKEGQLEFFTVAPPNSLAPAELGIHKVSLEKAQRALDQVAAHCGGMVILSVFFEQRKARSDVSVFEPAQRHSQLIWVSDGVVVERENLPFKTSVGVGIVLSANGLETDLTGLRPRESEQKIARKRTILTLAARELRVLDERLQGRGVDVSHEFGSVYKKGIIGSLLLFAVPIIGLAYLTRLGFNYKYAEDKMDEFDRVYDHQFLKLVDKMARLAENE